MKRTYRFILVCLLAVLAYSCDEDEYVYPSVITDFTDIHTNGKGELAYIYTDKAEKYEIEKREGLGGLTPDSVYRTISVFSKPTSDDRSFLYSAKLIVAPYPVPVAEFKQDIKTDPLGIQSIWQANRYINMILLPIVKDKTHYYHFIENGIRTNADGIKRLDITLYHNQNNDYKGYSKETYLSIPLYHYVDRLSNGDTIQLHINTFDGPTIRKFPFKK